jgi:hypothetical protein
MPTPPLEHVDALRLESERRLAMLATTLMLIPGVLWAYVDVSLVANRGTLFVLHGMRVVQLLAWGVGIFIIRRANTRERLRRVLFTLALFIVVFVAVNAWLRPATNWMPLRVMVLISIGTFVVYPYQFRRQLIAWLALVAVVLSLTFGHYAAMPAYDRASALLTILIAGVLGMAIARNRTQLDRDLDDALRREQAAIQAREKALAELRRLEGIIPICAYCHQVRTEAGAWEQLDQYVRARSDADFSHGMCPKCAREHFPEIMDQADDPVSGSPTPGR